MVEQVLGCLDAPPAAQPVYLVSMSQLQQVPLSAWMWSSIYSSLGFTLALMLGVFWVSTRRSIARLEEMEVALSLLVGWPRVFAEPDLGLFETDFSFGHSKHKGFSYTPGSHWGEPVQFEKKAGRNLGNPLVAVYKRMVVAERFEQGGSLSKQDRLRFRHSSLLDAQTQQRAPRRLVTRTPRPSLL